MSDTDTNDVPSIEQAELDKENIRAIDENRYVVSSDGESSSPPVTDGGKSQLSSHTNRPSDGLGDLDGAYAIQIEARFETETETVAIETNDVTDAAESLLRWYAEHVGGETPPEEVIPVLLANADLDTDSNQP